MLMLTSPELWALERRTDLDLTGVLADLAVRDRGEGFDEVALLGLVCRGPAAADLSENIVVHPTTASLLHLLAVATDGFNTLSIGAQQVGSTRYLESDGGFVSIEKGANDVYGFQAVVTEADLPTFVASNIVAAMSREGSELTDVVVRRTNASDDDDVVALRKADEGSYVIEPQGTSFDDLETLVGVLSGAIDDLQEVMV